MRTVHWCVLGSTCVSILIPAVTGAQKKPKTARPTVSQTATQAALPPALIRLPSDTGRMLRGHSDFSGYVTPGMCEMAVRMIANKVLRASGRDTTARESQYGDTLPTIAVETGRKCMANFSVAATAPSELLNLQQLALAVGDNTVAQSVVTRQLTLAKTIEDSARVLQQSVEAALSAKPFQLQTARSSLAQLEALGPRVGKTILMAQQKMLEMYSIRFDIDGLKTVSTAMLSLAAKLPGADRDVVALAIKAAWLAKRDLAYWEAPDSVPSVLMQMQMDMGPLRNGQGAPRDMMDPARMRVDQIVIPQLSKPLRNLPSSPRYVWPLSPSSELQNGKLPRGVVHLVLLTNETWALREIGMIRRLHEKYGAQGLSITLALGTLGYTTWNKSSVYTPQEEAASIQELIDNQLHLPVSFFVEEISISHLPDGRKSYGPMQWFERTPVYALIVDRDGVLQMGLAPSYYTPEAAIEAYIRRALGVTTATKGDVEKSE